MLVSTPDVSLHVEAYGTRGAHVLLIHGLGGSARTWREIASPLAAARRVIAVDLRGCGDSGRGTEAFTLDLLADDCVAVLDGLGADRCHVVGHSLGGVIAQNLLTRHNERCLSAVLISTSSLVNDDAAQGWRRLADKVEARGIGDSPAARRGMFSEAFADRHPEIVDAHGDLMAASDPHVYAALARAASRYDYTEALRSVLQPVLIIQGLADKLTRPGGSVIMARSLEHAELEMVEDVGHNAHIEMGRRFVERLDRFFDAAEGA